MDNILQGKHILIGSVHENGWKKTIPRGWRAQMNAHKDLDWGKISDPNFLSPLYSFSLTAMNNYHINLYLAFLPQYEELRLIHKRTD